METRTRNKASQALGYLVQSMESLPKDNSIPELSTINTLLFTAKRQLVSMLELQDNTATAQHKTVCHNPDMVESVTIPAGKAGWICEDGTIQPKPARRYVIHTGSGVYAIWTDGSQERTVTGLDGIYRDMASIPVKGNSKSMVLAKTSDGRTALRINLLVLEKTV